MNVYSVAVITKLSSISREVSEKSDRLQGTDAPLRNILAGRYE